MVPSPGKIKVAQLLKELNIEFLTLKSFLDKNLRGGKAMISLNTRLDEKVAGLCRQAFYRDKSIKERSQQVKWSQPVTKTSEPKGQETGVKEKDLERYRSIIKQSKKKRAAKKAKGKSKTSNPKGYIQIVSGGLCNPR